ncbi:MAG: succinylglutamate desuccinylase/aspartoacylase family protein [Candidatus Binatia bacterium]
MALELSPSPADIPRELGGYGGTTPGPLVICIGGMHGNEPAGIFAARRVLQTLQTTQPVFRGEFIALSGNRTALAQHCRYISQDFNRLWTAARMSSLHRSPAPAPQNPEETEQQELLAAIESALARRRGPVIFLDLHTTSADGVAFTVISDTILNRRLALSIPAPVILGLEECLDGTTLNYINNLGYIAVGFEGGQHEAPTSIEHHEAAIWTILQTAGCLRAKDAPQAQTLREQLARNTKNAPRIVEVRYRHAVQEDDQFVMEPGFVNFHPVKRGQLLARSRRGDIRAGETGFILMPLYQNQGADGFFLVRTVKPFWMQVAFWLRRLRLERVLPWLPGIHRHPTLPDTLLVNSHITRWFVIELLHLLGFRKQRVEGELLVVSRRPHDAFSFEE